MADFQWMGEWFGGVTGSTVPYSEHNNVTYNGAYYMCVGFAPIGSPSPDMDTQNWNVILRDGLAGSSGMAGSSGSSGESGAGGSDYHWHNGSEAEFIAAGTIKTIGSDYVMIDSALEIEGPVDDNFGSTITVSGKTYSRNGKLVVFGDLVLADMDVVNNGEIKVDKGLILDGEVSITGNGIII